MFSEQEKAHGFMLATLRKYVGELEENEGREADRAAIADANKNMVFERVEGFPGQEERKYYQQHKKGRREKKDARTQGRRGRPGSEAFPVVAG